MALNLVACGLHLSDALCGSAEIPIGAKPVGYEDREQDKWVRSDDGRDARAGRDDVLTCGERNQMHKQETSG